jgi:hypothetical protein
MKIRVANVVQRVQADSTTDRRHNSQPPSRENADTKALAGAQNRNRSKLASDHHRRSMSVGHLAPRGACSEAAQEVTASSDDPLNQPGKSQFGGAAVEAATHAISNARHKHAHAEASVGILKVSSKPHAEFQSTLAGMDARTAPVKHPEESAAASLQRKAAVQPAGPSIASDRYAASSAYRDAQPPRVEQSSSRHQSIRLKPETQPPTQLSDRHATAHADMMSPESRLQSGCVGSLARDGRGSPARVLRHVSDQPLIASLAAQNSYIAPLKDEGERRMRTADPFSSLRPATSAGVSSSDRISAGIEGPVGMTSPLAKAPSLSGALFAVTQHHALNIQASNKKKKKKNGWLKQCV